MSDNAQDKAQIIQMSPLTNSASVTGQVWFDFTLQHLMINIGGTIYQLDHPKTSAYTVTNVTPSRSINATSQTITTLSQIVGTLLTDLQSVGLVG